MEGNLQERQAAKLYAHIKELAQIKYENELRREDSIIQQSSNMQTAFAFMTAALFAAAAIIYQNKGTLSFEFLLAIFSSITLCLLLSLVFASLAQRRRKSQAIPDIMTIETFVDENWEQTLTEAQQAKQFVQLLGKVQKSVAENNDKRITLIRISMACFFGSIGMIVIWFILTFIIY